MIRFGLITRIALLVVCVEVAAFSALGWFYIDKFGTAVDERTRSRLQLVGHMIAKDELAVHAVSRQELISKMVGAPYLSGMVIGGNGRVIVATDPAFLGQPASRVPGFDAGLIADPAPDEQFIAGGDTLTGIMHIHGDRGGPALYYTVITISTAELNAQKRAIVLWGQVGSLLFILLSSAAIILIAQRLITRRVDTSLAVLKQVEEGALDARIPVRSDDELGQLQLGINSMTAKVGALLDQHRRNEEELSTILNAIGDGVIAIGPEGNVLRCNPSAAAILGIEPGACACGQVGELLPELPAELDPHWWRTADIVTGQGRIHFERQGPDGVPRSIELGHGPIREPDGTVVGAVLVLQDITERRQAEEKIRATSRLLDSIVEHIPNMIFLKRASDLRFVLFNKAGEELLGFDRADLLGKNDHDFFPAEQADFFTAKDREVLRSDAVLDIPEETIATRDGDRRVLHTKKLALHDSRGEAEFLLGISEDITEFKRNAEELEHHRDHLEELVAERTRELNDARLAAEAASRAKSVFLANMSHELRTPLNAILGYAQILERDERIPEDRRQNLRTINKSGQNLLSLINDILEISRIEAGRLHLSPSTVDLPGLLASLAETMSGRARDKGLALRLEASDDLPRVIYTDVLKLRQILLNLLSNAVKYTRSGEVVLSARSVSAVDGQVVLEFTVRDTGVGIAADELERIFAAFYQTENGIRQGEGTGLGLTISREYAELLGGRLTVESTVGKGSAFRLELAVEVREPSAETAPALGRVTGLRPGQPEYRILVAEDEPVNQEVLRNWLDGVGFSVEVADNGREAVERFQTWRPHLIFMDMRMPVMDGMAATRVIRAMPEGKAVPIIAFTASVFEEERKDMLAAGCSDVMTKPLEEGRLFELLGRQLGVAFEQAAEVEEKPVPPIDFGALPAEVKESLRNAARMLDMDAVGQITREIQAEYPAIARRLEELVEAYNFDAIITQLTN